MAWQLEIRQSSMRWTDSRAKLVQELLGGMRVVKWFTYEKSFLRRLWVIRDMELKGIWWMLLIRAGNQALSYSVPVVSATLAIVTYTLSGNPLDPAVIFTSLSLFQLLRQPLMFLPRALSCIADAQSALQRLNPLFHAELINETAFKIDPKLDVALRVDKASFRWERTSQSNDREAMHEKSKSAETSTEEYPASPRGPFEIENLDMTIPRGQLCAIVGPVGSGKSTILLGLIGEMRCIGGSCTFGGSVAYCPQSAWIKNATLRDNILFNRPFDKQRYWKVLQDSCLLPDLAALPDSDMSEIGEKGINLSGGQKQRVNIARALYSDADVVIFDDPLSAVDAHVGKALFANAILGTLKVQGKTVILVTHALHFLPQVDFVYTVVNGNVAEQGPYDELIKRNGSFARLVAEFGGGGEALEEKQMEEEDLHGQPMPTGKRVEKEKVSYETLAKEGSGTLEGRLIRAEKRIIGSVSLKVYMSYLRAGKGEYTIPLVIISAVLMQASSVLNSMFLVWWQSNTFHRSQAFYMTIYGCLGASQAFFTFSLGIALSWLSILASKNLFKKAMEKILHAPMSVFDTTPLGRMMSVLGKDIDVMDNLLSESVRTSIITLSVVFGSVLVVTIFTQFFLAVAIFVLAGYVYLASFHRISARELKRLDAQLRSILYSHFSESLSGLPTIRAYGEVPRYLAENEFYIDLENRALYPIITTQRWLSVRLGCLSAILVFVVAILAVVGINGLSPAQIGLIMTYTTTLTQALEHVTRNSAEVESSMSGVERVVHYSNDDALDQEPPHERDDVKPPQEWPPAGSIEFKDVIMSYRPGLDPVLKGVSMSVRAGEKIGVVGRTGAGKSSLMVALFRLVELRSGSIHIDGIDISSLGLQDVRSKIAIIPQEPLLFSGTIRTNLDPFGVYDDAHLWDALRRAHLVEDPNNPLDKKPLNEKMDNVHVIVEDADGSGSCISTQRFGLDTAVECEGANLSVGERSLLSLARALVKDAKVIVLDEATASVDFEMDSKIQATIQAEFKDRTLLCIAHRIRTILAYDRILVMDNGQISEFGTPVDLFKKESGIFYNMCLKSNITLSDILEKNSNSDHS